MVQVKTFYSNEMFENYIPKYHRLTHLLKIGLNGSTAHDLKV